MFTFEQVDPVEVHLDFEEFDGEQDSLTWSTTQCVIQFDVLSAGKRKDSGLD